MPPNLLKRKIEEGRLVLGMYFVSGDPMHLELIGRAGLDFVVIDMEHAPLSPLDQTGLRPLIHVALLHGVTPIVRVPANDAVFIGKVLDAGAQGVAVPHVKDKASAMRAVAAARFPPEGIRGAGPLAPSNGWVGEPGPYFSSTNQEIMVTTLLEDKESIDNFEEISDVPGLAWFRPGVWDLALSMGHRDPAHPAVQAARAKVYEIGKRKKLRMADSAHDSAKMKQRIADGIRIFTITDEPHMFYNACKAKVDEARAFAAAAGVGAG